MDLEQLFLEHIALSWDKQRVLGEVIQNAPRWEWDMSEGTLSFSNGLSFKMQVIGSEGNISKTWLWSWANTGSPTPPRLLQAVLKMKNFGQAHRIKALTTPQLPLNEQFNGFRFTMIASGMYKANALYRGPYETGNLFMLIKDEKYPKPTFHPVERVVDIFPQLLAMVELSNQQVALKHYCRSYGLAVEADGGELTALHADGSSLHASFDETNRLKDINATMKAN